MRLFPRLVSLWKTLFTKERLDRELDEEIRATIETLADGFVAGGMSRQAARRAAVAALGASGGPGIILQIKENVRDGRLGAGLDALLLDLRCGWRGLWNARALTAVIVATLALGIGANTAMFSVVHAMLLQPLSYRDADRLAFIWLGVSRGPLSGPDFRDIRQGTTTFDELGGIWASGTIALSGNGDPEQLRGAVVTTNFFRVLGAESALGRTFRSEDSLPGAPATIVLGWDLFQRRFGGDSSIIGRQILIDDEPTTVIGVMPRAFRLLLPPDASVPDHLQAWQPLWPDFESGPRGNLFLRVVGRMRSGVTIAQARADVDAIARRVAGGLGSSRAFTTVALQADDVREIRGPLLALFAGVGILLTIACVNVGSLLIARAASREKETALRLALGASRGRLIRQSLVEGLLLTSLGAAAGLFAGDAALRVLLALAPESLSRIGTSRIDVTVLGFTLAISLVWGLLFSLAPVAALFRISASGESRPSWRVWRFREAHRGSENVLVSRGGPRGPIRYRTRALLVVVQIALSVVLLVAAGLLVRTFAEVQRIDPGFRADRHLTFRVAFPGSRYQTTDALINAADGELRRRLAGLPGVTGVGAISHLPYDDLPNWALTYALEAAPSQGAAPRANTRSISTGLLETLSAQLIEGRFFTDEDNPANPVVIVDDTLARRLWPGQSALGQQILLGQASPDRRASVVGVVRHLRLRSIVDDFTPQVFVSYRIWQRTPMAYVVRTDRAPSALTAEIRAAVADLDPELPIFDVTPMQTYVEAARSIRRFTVLLAALFAVCALVLSCIGVYGVLAYVVTLRRHEFGLRRALGADASHVRREVLREGLRFALVGCSAGLVGATIAAWLLKSQLYAVHPRDPITYIVSLAIILTAATIACWIPAHRATRISPMDALRTE